jgi:hypothetical protein
VTNDGSSGVCEQQSSKQCDSSALDVRVLLPGEHRQIHRRTR